MWACYNPGLQVVAKWHYSCISVIFKRKCINGNIVQFLNFFPWISFDTFENQLLSGRTQRKSPSGQSSHQARSDISGVVDYEIHFPFITSTLHHNLEMCTNYALASTRNHRPLTINRNRHSRENITQIQTQLAISVFFFSDERDRKCVWGWRLVGM